MTAAIILAAGESSRLGQPKQNLLFEGETLLQRTVNAAQRSKCNPIIVVLGANADKIKPIPETRILYNKDWREGMASSIRIAIKEIENNNSISDLLIMLCDQPFVSSELIGEMLQQRLHSQSLIIACNYNNTLGVPVLFDRSLLPELLLLSGNEGAKSVIMNHSKDVKVVPFNLGSVDIDTNADYRKLLQNS